MAMRARTPDLERLFTADEFEAMPEFDERYELLDGRLAGKPVPGQEHSFIIDVIRDAIKAFDPKRSLGYSLQESSVVLGLRNVPTPDMAYWKADRGVKITKKAGPLPDLAVEVHSPSDLKSPTDLASAMVKVEKLLLAGVPIVWVVYSDRQTVEVYHADREYRAGPMRTLGVTDTLDGEGVIPGFTMAVADIFSLNQ